MIKTFAEWQKQELLMLSIPHKNTDWSPYLDEILDAYEAFVKAVSEYQKVLLIAPFEYNFTRFSKYKNVEFLCVDTNDTWIRDYGAIDALEIGENLQTLNSNLENLKDEILPKNSENTYNSTSDSTQISAQNITKIISYNFKFNAWGGKFKADLDNAVNTQIFKKLSGNLIEIPLELEGGSIDFNGAGTLLTTTHCLLNQNRHHTDKNELEKKLKKIFGLTRIIWLEHGYILGDDTDAHVDTLARFIDENTIAYAACDDPRDPHFSELKLMKKELENTGFNLVPLFIPRAISYNGRRLGATYCNFVFINNALILPSYNDEIYDDLALKNLQKVIKNRDIIQVRADVFLRQNGSLHCSCMNRFLGKRD
ncbi:MAG: agmatine deiminase family protein [Campylobacter sp.]